MGNNFNITEQEKNEILGKYGLLSEQILFGGMIPNPKKTITVNLPLDKVDDIVGYLPQHILEKHLNLGGYYFVKREQLFDTVVYEFLGSEMMSLGVKIILTLIDKGNENTEIEIEVRRAHGAFDRPIEVQKASEHLNNILRGLSFGVDKNNYDKIKNTYKGQPSVLGMGFKNHQQYKEAGEPDVHLMFDNGFRSYEEYKNAGFPTLKSRSQLKKEKKEFEKAEREKLGIKPSFWDKLFGS